MFANVFRGLGTVSICLLLSGCLTPEKYEALSTALQGSASLRAKFTNQCINDRHLWSSDSRSALATIVTVSDSRNKRLICERLTNSIASGRLTLKDLNSFSDEFLTPNAIRVLRGK